MDPRFNFLALSVVSVVRLKGLLYLMLVADYVYTVYHNLLWGAFKGTGTGRV